MIALALARLALALLLAGVGVVVGLWHVFTGGPPLEALAYACLLSWAGMALAPDSQTVGDMVRRLKLT